MIKKMYSIHHLLYSSKINREDVSLIDSSIPPNLATSPIGDI